MLSDESCPDILSVDTELHAVETLFDDTASMVCHASAGICNYFCLSVLHHNHAVFVVYICDGIGIGRECVEEQFLASQILGESLVIIQMVMSEI